MCRVSFLSHDNYFNFNFILFNTMMIMIISQAFLLLKLRVFKCLTFQLLNVTSTGVFRLRLKGTFSPLPLLFDCTKPESDIVSFWTLQSFLLLTYLLTYLQHLLRPENVSQSRYSIFVLNKMNKSRISYP